MKRIIEDTSQLMPIIADVCHQLAGSWQESVNKLLLGTAAVESRLIYRKQFGGGPARGICQMEPFTALCIFDNYLQYRPELYRRLVELWRGKFTKYSTPTESFLGNCLENDDLFAFALAYVHYRRYGMLQQEKLGSLEDIAKVWKSCYNTHLGRGKVEDFISAWHECHCDDLVRNYGKY